LIQVERDEDLYCCTIISKEFIRKEDVRKRVGNYVRPDTDVDFVFIDYGPASIESRYDDVMAVPFVVKKAEWAEKNGYDPVVVSCMMDPGVKAAKGALYIPHRGARRGRESDSLYRRWRGYTLRDNGA